MKIEPIPDAGMIASRRIGVEEDQLFFYYWIYRSGGYIYFCPSKLTVGTSHIYYFFTRLCEDYLNKNPNKEEELANQNQNQNKTKTRKKGGDKK